MNAAPLTRLAPAKVNLFLHVTGRRPAGSSHAGYHDLESLVVFARDETASDSIAAAPADTLGLTLDGPQAMALHAASLADGMDNLVLRAARMLQPMIVAGPKGAALTLTKTLPVASGVGGGSADAAAALHVLRALWNIAIDDDALAQAALQLGADVPVCLGSRAAMMSGVGERLTAVPALPPAWLDALMGLVYPASLGMDEAFTQVLRSR